MSKIVFILGAGASVHAGAPVMVGFLDKARDIFASRQCGEWEDDFRAVFDAISNLQQVHSKSELNLNNLESLFTTFEMAQTIQKLPGYSADEIPALINSFTALIFRTLDASMQFPLAPTSYQGGDAIPRHITAPISYRLFAELIRRLSGRGLNYVSIITFNYDVGLDLHSRRRG